MISLKEEMIFELQDAIDKNLAILGLTMNQKLDYVRRKYNKLPCELDLNQLIEYHDFTCRIRKIHQL